MHLGGRGRRTRSRPAHPESAHAPRRWVAWADKGCVTGELVRDGRALLAQGPPDGAAHCAGPLLGLAARAGRGLPVGARGAARRRSSGLDQQIGAFSWEIRRVSRQIADHGLGDVPVPPPTAKIADYQACPAP
jgi:hypothetical protein